MKFKNIKQLKKKIKEWKHYEVYVDGKKEFYPIAPEKLGELKATLTQTKGFEKLIEEGCGREINPYKKIKMPCGGIAGGKVLYCGRCEELLTKIRGDGE